MSTHPCTFIIHANGRNVKRFSQNSAFFIEPARQVPKAPFPGVRQMIKSDPIIQKQLLPFVWRELFSLYG